MKIITAGLICEINTFSPTHVTMQDFKDCYYQESGKHSDHYWAAPLKMVADVAKRKNWECIESLCAGAMPGGPLRQKVYESLRNKILQDVELYVDDLDLVFLHLHGAMVSEGCEDCEGDLLFRIRQVVGERVIIAAILDPHTHLTEKMSQSANMMIWLKEYPHTDIHERTEELLEIIEGTIAKKYHPETCIVDCEMIDLFPTTTEPMKSIVDEIKRIENTDQDVLNISIVHGFPWGDVDEGFGTKVSVITNNNITKAREVAEKIKELLRLNKGKFLGKFYDLNEAVRYVQDDTNEGLVVLADFADNVGGGAPGDSTFALETVLKEKLRNGAIACIWDPGAVKQAESSEVGCEMKLSLGGKSGLGSGKPVEVTAKVVKLVPELSVEFAGSMMSYGKAVWLKVSELNLDIVVNNIRCQTYSTECFSKMGINLGEKRFAVVKSMEHYRKSFSKVSQHLLPLKSPGALCPDLSKIPYRKKGKFFFKSSDQNPVGSMLCQHSQ